ncbi:DUF6233 domain-containing protein [Streptomyces caeruleatus]|uniref:DUF6233 domain-containing protein n=1 Tax=Streptomyces caeruleatus TaxID=661399 RepID=UPI003CC53E6D
MWCPSESQSRRRGSGPGWHAQIQQEGRQHHGGGRWSPRAVCQIDGGRWDPRAAPADGLSVAAAGGGVRARRGVLHAPDCDEAPRGAPVLKADRVLDAAEKAGVRLCTLCGFGPNR